MRLFGRTYYALCGQWIPAQGRDIAAAPAFEVYKNNLQETEPKKLAAKVHVPPATRAAASVFA